MMSLVKMPDLMIYIRSTIPNLVQQIQKRGRDYEQTMRLDYLEGLNKRYEDWIADYKGNLVIINGDEVKFACVDGPDFDAHLVDFDSLIKRAAFYKEEQDAADRHICRMTGGKRVNG